MATDTSKATKQEDVAAGSAQDYVGSGNISAYNPYKVGPIRYGLYGYIRKYLETYKPKFTTDELKFTVEDGRVLMKIGTSGKLQCGFISANYTCFQMVTRTKQRCLRTRTGRSRPAL